MTDKQLKLFDTPHSANAKYQKQSQNDGMAALAHTLKNSTGNGIPFISGKIDDPTALELYQNNALARKVIDVPIRDAVSKWRVWDASQETNDTIRVFERNKNIKEILIDGLVNAHVYGGCAIYMSVNGTGAPNTELDLSLVTKDSLAFLQIMPRDAFQPLEIDYSISPNHGKPVMYKLIMNILGMGANRSNTNDIQEIHPSRMIILKGKVHPLQYNSNDPRAFWGYSNYQSIWDTLKNLDDGYNNVSQLMSEAKTTILKAVGLGEILERDDPTEMAGIANTLRSLDMWKGNFNTVPVDSENDYEQLPYKFDGIEEVVNVLLIRLAAESQIPLTALAGISPSGQNNTGANDQVNYTKFLDEFQDELRNSLTMLDRVIAISALGDEGREIDYRWADTDIPSRKEKAQAFRMTADTIARLKTAGLVEDKRSVGVIQRLLKENGLEIREEELASIVVPEQPNQNPDATDDRVGG